MNYTLINKFLTSIKGECFELDNSIPLGYFTGYIISKTISLFWGMIRLRTLKKAFVHPSAVIKCSGKIKLNGNISIDRGCYIDALSRNGLILGNNVSFGYFTTLRITGSFKNMVHPTFRVIK